MLTGHNHVFRLQYRKRGLAYKITPNGLKDEMDIQTFW